MKRSLTPTQPGFGTVDELLRRYQALLEARPAFTDFGLIFLRNSVGLGTYVLFPSGADVEIDGCVLGDRTDFC